MEIHTLLNNEVDAFDFEQNDCEPLLLVALDLKIVHHNTADSLLAQADNVDFVLCWAFESAWYQQFPRLQAVFTPAAGDDWVTPDPRGRVQLIHGTFHGQLLAESLLGALLFMNHRMPLMMGNHRAKQWNRNLQTTSSLLSNQTVLIVGLGHIGLACANKIAPLVQKVIGVKRDITTVGETAPNVEVRSSDDLDDLLPLADHVAVVLPATQQTDRILDTTRLRRCKPSAYVYNFGRGNAIATLDLIAASTSIGGAFLDVVDLEPLPGDSPLWDLPNVMITPHSSCVYADYKRLFITEVAAHLQGGGQSKVPE